MRILLGCLIFIISFTVAAIPTDLPLHSTVTNSDVKPGKAKKLYAKGIKALSTGNMDAAEKAFKASIKVSPNIYALLGLAEVAFQKKKVAEAKQYIKQAVKISPDNPYTQSSLARLYILEKKYNKAEKAYKKSLAAGSSLAKTHIALGDLYLQLLNKPVAAINSYKNALKISPDHGGAHYALGVAYLRGLNDVRSAEIELKKAAQLQPGNPLPFQMLGKLYTHSQQFDKALKVYSDLIKKHPKLFAARFGRANVYLAQKSYKQAEKEFKQLTTMLPGNTEAWMNLGVVYQTQGKLHLAEQAYLNAIKLNPKLAIAYNNLAWMSADKTTALNKALKWATRAVKINPNSADFYDTLGWVYKARKEYPLAIKTFRKANKIKQSPDIYFHLGLTYLDKGDKSRAKSAFLKALSINKNFTHSDKVRKILTRL